MSQFLVILVSFVVAALIFLLCRELMCWYWKINQALEVLRGINVELQRLNNVGRAQLEATERAIAPRSEAANG